MPTRGVFAAINGLKERHESPGILLSDRQDGKGWNLPGGTQLEGEDDETTLRREVLEETGLEVEVLFRIGPDHVFGQDTAVLFHCRTLGGVLTTTAEAREQRFVTRESIDGLRIQGPEGRLGRMGRMIWDALSIQEEPDFDEETEDGESVDPIYVSTDGTRLCQKTQQTYTEWVRMDPYSKTGKMEPVGAPPM